MVARSPGIKTVPAAMEEDIAAAAAAIITVWLRAETKSYQKLKLYVNLVALSLDVVWDWSLSFLCGLKWFLFLNDLGHWFLAFDTWSCGSLWLADSLSGNLYCWLQLLPKGGGEKLWTEIMLPFRPLCFSYLWSLQGTLF